MDWVRELVRDHLGENVGPETRRNGSPPDTDLTIDYTFDGCTDRFALEITTLGDYFESPSDEHWKQFQIGLEREAKNIGWPDWFIAIRSETKLNPTLLKSVATMMRFAQELDVEELGAATFAKDLGPDLASRMQPHFYRACNQARLNGVIYVARKRSGGVWFLEGRESSDSHSLARPVDRAMVAKSKPLGVAKRRGYWTMLAIDVERQDAHGYLAEGVHAPRLPAEIDHLWLLVREAPDGALRDAYYARRGGHRRLVRAGP